MLKDRQYYCFERLHLTQNIKFSEKISGHPTMCMHIGITVSIIIYLWSYNQQSESYDNATDQNITDITTVSTIKG